jgi:hypothetical protein
MLALYRGIINKKQATHSSLINALTARDADPGSHLKEEKKRSRPCDNITSNKLKILDAKPTFTLRYFILNGLAGLRPAIPLFKIESTGERPR